MGWSSSLWDPTRIGTGKFFLILRKTVQCKTYDNYCTHDPTYKLKVHRSCNLRSGTIVPSLLCLLMSALAKTKIESEGLIAGYRSCNMKISFCLSLTSGAISFHCSPKDKKEFFSFGSSYMLLFQGVRSYPRVSTVLPSFRAYISNLSSSSHDIYQLRSGSWVSQPLGRGANVAWLRSAWFWLESRSAWKSFIWNWPCWKVKRTFLANSGFF